jgi:hypothetical protein
MKYFTNYLDALPDELNEHINNFVFAFECHSKVIIELSMIKHSFQVELPNTDIMCHVIDYTDAPNSSKYLTLQKRDEIINIESKISLYQKEQVEKSRYNDCLSIFVESVDDNKQYKMIYRELHAGN